MLEQMARQTDDVDKASHALLYLGKAHLRLKSLAAAVEALTSSIQNITAPQPSADRLCSVHQSIDGYRAELECASARGVRAISAFACRTHCSTEGARYGAQANAGSGNAC